MKSGSRTLLYAKDALLRDVLPWVSELAEAPEFERRWDAEDGAECFCCTIESLIARGWEMEDDEEDLINGAEVGWNVEKEKESENVRKNTAI